MPHIPVLLQDVLSFIENSPNQKGFLLDGTFGRGGHTKAILDAYPQIQVIGFDRDIDAINYGQDHYAGRGCQWSFVLDSCELCGCFRKALFMARGHKSKKGFNLYY